MLDVGGIFAKLEARFDDSGFKRFDRALDRAERQARPGVSTRGRMDVDRTGFDRYDSRLRASERQSEQSTGRMRKHMGGVGTAAASAAGAGGLLALGTALASTVGAGARFERTMSEVEAVSGASKREIRQLSDAARDLGTSTGLGAGKAADAVRELAKGGLSAKQIIGGGLKGALSLAAAGGMELADAASTTANALNLFGLGGDQATHVADALATAANATTADVSDFALALSQGGAAAKAAGLDLDQTTVALEAMAANGVKGSDAGTSLKSALTQIANPTKEAASLTKKLGLEFFDAHGNIRSLTDISGQLQEKMGGLSKQQRLQAASTIAGTDGMRTLLALYDTGPKRLGGFADGLHKSGTAAAVARKNQDNLTGSFNRLRANAENVAISLFRVLGPSLKFVIDRINGLGGNVRDLVHWFKGGSTAADVTATALGALAGVTALLVGRMVALGIISRVTLAIAAMRRALFAAQVAMYLLNGAIAANPIGAVIVVLAALAGALVVAYKRSDTFRHIVDSAFTVVKKTVAGFARVWLSMVDGMLFGIQKVAEAAGHLPGVGSKFDGVAKDIQGVRDKLKGYRKDLEDVGKEHKKVGDSSDKLGDRVRDARKRFNEAKEAVGKYKTGTDEWRGAMKKAADRAGDLKDAIHDQRKAARDAVRPFVTLTANVVGFGQTVANVAESTGGNVNETLKVLGAKALHFTVKHPKKAGAAAGGIAGAVANLFATGGIPNPGSGSRDDHILIDPYGRPVAAMSGTEGILNTPQMGEVHHALRVAHAVGESRYGGLDQLWRSGMTHHAGGGIVGVPGFPGERAASSVIPEIESIAHRFRLTLTDAFGQGHKSPGHTRYGTAADFAGPDSSMDAAVRFLVGKGYLVGYDGRYGSQDWPGHGPAAGQGGSNAHLHVELGSSSGAGAAARVPALAIDGPAGPLLTGIRAGARKLRAAGQRKVDAAAGALSGHGPGAFAQGADANVVSAFRRAIRATGANPEERLALWEAGIVESGLKNLDHGDADSLGSLQERVSIYGRGHALNPGASAVRFLTDAKALRPWGGSAGALAQAVQRSAFPGRYDAVASQARRYLARGGKLRRFAGGGALGDTDFHGPGGYAGDAWAKSKTLRHMQSDRVKRYDDLVGDVEDLNTRYSVKDRTYGLSEEELVDPDTGAVNADAVKHRGDELKKLMQIRKSIVAKYVAARGVARRAVGTYKVLIGRVTRSLKSAKKKDRPGLKKLRRTYLGRRAEWQDNLKSIRTDLLPNARLDLRELANERAGVLGTTAEVEDVPEVDDPAPEDAAPTDDPVVDTGPTDDGGAATQQQIAEAASAMFSQFQASRADLFGGMGANFVTPRQGYAPEQQAAGTRYFGGATGGTEGGADAGAGGTPAVTQYITFTGPQPADPHTFTQASLHELQAAL